jgi:glycosyltransferase involved in cell wall biosynthesis
VHRPEASLVPQPHRVVHMTSAHSATDTRIFVKECATLAAAGFEVHLIAPDARAAVERGVRRWPVAPAAGGHRLRRMTLTVLEVYRRARALDAAIYHFHDPELMPAGLMLAGGGARVVYDAHEDLAATVLDKAWIHARLRRPAARVVGRLEPMAADRLAAVVAATPAIAERFAACRRPVVVVNNYPDLDEFAVGPAERRPASAAPTVCYVGAISAIRGAAVMVDAIERTDAQLVMAGAIETDELAAALRRRPGWARVRSRGTLPRDALADVYSGASAGLVLFGTAANHTRSQPTKLFEYMAAGLPVIASDFPLWREIVEGNGCGICVDPTSPDQVAGAIRALVGDPERARRMGENGRRAVLERYRWDHQGRVLTELYRTVLA